MTALHFDAWTEREVAELEVWRIDLCQKLRQVFPPEITVEILTYRDARRQEIRRFANTYDGLTQTAKVEINYPEPTADIITRVLEAHNEHTHRPSEGTG